MSRVIKIGWGGEGGEGCAVYDVFVDRPPLAQLLS